MKFIQLMKFIKEYKFDYRSINQDRLVYFAGKWPLRVLEQRANKLDFTKWEKEFIEIFASNLKPEDIIFDIGAEEGEFSALAATLTNGSQVHMFEPRQQIWNNIKMVWKYNKLEDPGGCWAGFVSDNTSNLKLNKSDFFPWPKTKGRDKLQMHSRFESLLNPKGIPSITMDNYVKITGVNPTVIIMDIEGAEVLALNGSMNTLSKLRPVVFISVHKAHQFSNFSCEQEQLFRIFSSIGYKSHFISIDHEKHWVFWDPKIRSLQLKKNRFI